MRKSTTVVLGLVPVVALFAGAGFMQPEGQAPGRRGGGQQPADPGAFVDRIMQQDADGDGKVSRDEMGDGPGARMFDGADANEDGFLEKAEIEKFFSERRGAGNRPGQRPGAAGQPEAPAPASFHDSMESAGRALRRLRRSAFNAESRVGDLAGIEAIQRAMLDAKTAHLTAEVSEKAEAEFGGDGPKLRDALRLNIARGLQAAIDMEVAVLEGNAKAASAALDKLMEVRNQGHDLFEPEEQDD